MASLAIDVEAHLFSFSCMRTVKRHWFLSMFRVNKFQIRPKCGPNRIVFGRTHLEFCNMLSLIIIDLYYYYSFHIFFYFQLFRPEYH
jgi:hypothetical protein